MLKPRHRPGAAVGGAVAAALALLVPLAGCGDGGGDVSARNGADGFDGDRAFAAVEAQVALGPRPSGSDANQRLARLLVDRLGRAGVDDVRIQRPVANVVGTIGGGGEGWIVLGAHYDTKDLPGFVGANDGASGVAVVLELARTLPRPQRGPSIAVALFDGEEARGDRDFEADGLRGSRQYVEYAVDGRQGTPPATAIEAMVLLDMVGDCDLEIPREERSDPGIWAELAAADPELFDGATGAISDDHVPFLEAGIPAVDVIDFQFGAGPPPGELWHTAGDDLDAVCPASLDAVGGALLRALPRIGVE
ncbi:MAG TPA: M28 family metallopeptidase [Solirubrobacterales bacterium]|nr:M28 family metallopeptidase [Solirubrobacterales bacterium]